MDSDKNITANFVLSTGSILKYEETQNISIYPNPAKGNSINIQCSAPEGMATIEIADMNGRLILSRTEHVNRQVIQLPINILINGIYILTVSSDHFTHNQKLIIE